MRHGDLYGTPIYAVSVLSSPNILATCNEGLPVNASRSIVRFVAVGPYMVLNLSRLITVTDTKMAGFARAALAS